VSPALHIHHLREGWHPHVCAEAVSGEAAGPRQSRVVARDFFLHRPLADVDVVRAVARELEAAS